MTKMVCEESAMMALRALNTENKELIARIAELEAELEAARMEARQANDRAAEYHRDMESAYADRNIVQGLLDKARQMNETAKKLVCGQVCDRHGLVDFAEFAEKEIAVGCGQCRMEELQQAQEALRDIGYGGTRSLSGLISIARAVVKPPETARRQFCLTCKHEPDWKGNQGKCKSALEFYGEDGAITMTRYSNPDDVITDGGGRVMNCTGWEAK